MKIASIPNVIYPCIVVGNGALVKYNPEVITRVIVQFFDDLHICYTVINVIDSGISLWVNSAYRAEGEVYIQDQLHGQLITQQGSQRFWRPSPSS